MNNMKKIVVIGGGTGTFVVLVGLKKYPVDLSAIVSMMDSGGSTGRLVDQLGVLPPGDLRQCLIALSEAPDLWRKLFLYRFQAGDLKGHNFGNIFLTALEKLSTNYQKVVDRASYILKTKGKVLPVTFDRAKLCVEYDDGEIIESESSIDQASHKKNRIIKAYLKPAANANKLALDALGKADYIIIGPGDLYTSLVPNLIVDQVAKTITGSQAKIINIMNLMTKMGQTANYKASDVTGDLESYLGRNIDLVLLNSAPFPRKVIDYYKNHGEETIENDLKEKYGHDKYLEIDLIDKKIYNQKSGDPLFRSLVRHDSQKLGEAIWKVIRT